MFDSNHMIALTDTNLANSLCEASAPGLAAEVAATVIGRMLGFFASFLILCIT
jgi:hypothetical protein